MRAILTVSIVILALRAAVFKGDFLHVQRKCIRTPTDNDLRSICVEAVLDQCNTFLRKLVQDPALHSHWTLLIQS